MSTPVPLFNARARLLHWMMAPLVVAMLFIGIGMLSTTSSAYALLLAIHKPLGAALLVIAATHGYMALRSIQLHTGSLAWLSFVVTASLGIAFYIRKKPPLFKWHKRAALFSVLLVLLHLFFPGALYYLM